MPYDAALWSTPRCETLSNAPAMFTASTRIEPPRLTSETQEWLRHVRRSDVLPESLLADGQGLFMLKMIDYGSVDNLLHDFGDNR